MISQPLNQTLLREPRTGAAGAAKESVRIVRLSSSVKLLGLRLNNMQDVEPMDPECSGNGVKTSFGNAKGGMVGGRLVLRNQLMGSSIE